MPMFVKDHDTPFKVDPMRVCIAPLKVVYPFFFWRQTTRRKRHTITFKLVYIIGDRI